MTPPDRDESALLVLGAADIAALLPMAECVDLMAAVLAAHASGRTLMPLRSITRLPIADAVFATMPAYLADAPAIGVKAMTWFPRNHGTGHDAHQGAVLLYEPEHGRLIAVMDASTITALRTAAVSAAATQVLARPDATRLGLLGTGTQAASHLEAMLVARPFSRVSVFSPDAPQCQRFVEAARRRHAIDIATARDARAAVAEAGVICTVTSSTTPVLERSWVQDGTHINAVGACFPAARELDSDTIAAARVIVDSRESARHESGDLLIPQREGRIGDDHVAAELGEVLAGNAAGRQRGDQITVFKSLGLAIEDVAAAHRLHANALKAGAGARVPFGAR